MPPAKDIAAGKCVIRTCSAHKNITIHRIPKDAAKCEAWLKNINDPDLSAIDPITLNKSYVVCKLHFSPDSYVPQTNRPALRPNAVPTLFLTSRKNEPDVKVDLRNIEVSNIQGLPVPVQSDIIDNIDNVSTDVVQDTPLVNNIVVKKRKRSSLLRFITNQSHLSPTARRLYKQANSFKKKADIYRRRNLSFEEFLNAATEYCEKNNVKSLFDKLTPKQILLMKSQLRIGDKTSRGRRFTLEEKTLALGLYKSSGRGYHIWKSVFPLPSTRTLLEMLGRLDLDTGLNRTLQKCLKNTVSHLKNPQDKLVTLVWDEMKLQPHLQYDPKTDKIIGFEDWGSRRTPSFADHALVFMIHGIRRNWKLPITFSFCSSQTKSAQLVTLIKSHVVALEKAGLTIVATVCNQAGRNVAAINQLRSMTLRQLLKSGETNNLDRVIISKTEIITLFDVPHLLKCTRNNLLNKHLEFKAINDDGNRHFANWDHLELLYYLDMSLDTEFQVRKISQYHVMRKHLDKLKVKYAAQAFSRTFAHTMATAAHHGFLSSSGQTMPKEGSDTSKMLLFFNDLFDSLNWRKGERSSAVRCRAVSRTSGHKRLWIESRRRIQDMQFVNRTSLLPVRSVPCLENWSITLTGFIKLWDRLLVKEEFDYFSPRNLNQDCLENFFGTVRSHGCRNVDLTCWQFVGTYKSLLVTDLNSHHSLTANCEDDEGNMLLNLSSMLEDSNSNCDDKITCEDDAPLPLNTNIKQQGPEQNLTRTACAYGYVARRLLKSVRHCPDCISTISAHAPLPDLHGDLEKKEYNPDERALTYVNHDFKKSFDKFDMIVRNALPSICYRRNLCKNLRVKLDEANCLEWLGCPVHASQIRSNFIKFSVSILVHAFCTIINRILTGKEVRYSNKTNRMFKQARGYRIKYSRKVNLH